jgi:hypothetical protein
MSIARKIAIPAALTTAALGSASAAAMAATTSHTGTTLAKAVTSHRTPRAIDILGHHGPGSITPHTALRCGTSTFGEASVCLNVVGHGTYVSYMSAWGCVIGSPFQDVHVQMVAPNGGTIRNSNTRNIHSGQCTSTIRWAPHHTEASGAYKAKLWAKEPSGFTDIATATVNVT